MTKTSTKIEKDVEKMVYLSHFFFLFVDRQVKRGIFYFILVRFYISHMILYGSMSTELIFL